ncbi:hypothetical protein DIPPA_32774 [Diplonema papillatum]|nr:hypothetical protein DIPPA_32774 [Diplonema papillatum]
MLLVSAAMCVQAVWEEHVGAVGMTTLLKRVHESTSEDVATCQTVAEGLGMTAILHKAENPQLCVVFKGGKDEVHATHDDSMTDYTVAYYFEEEQEEDSDSLSAGEIVATIILSIFYVACLAVLALTCTHNEVDIAAQMDMLEKKEMQIAEAVSEHFERKSQEYERRSREAEEKELAEIEKDTAQ